MESMAVNWEALDALVTDFAKSEHLIIDEDSSSSVSSSSSPSSSSSSLSPSTSSSSSSYQSRLLIRQIRRSLESGDVDSALDLLRLHAPLILDDHHLLFPLQKQKFIELLRKGTADDRDSAIHCVRTSLAPCALDAYPEAYEEFKHVLLAFIYDKNDQTSPVANEWSERRRLDMAGLLSSILRAHLNAYDPVFSMTLRYLISIHKGFCLRQGISSPISNLTERLLLEERDFPASPHESLYEVPPFDEVDIQALAHAVELTRQGAVDSLRFAKGDLFQAFQNELCRMRLDVSMLDEIVHEYCIYRGIAHSGPASPSASRVQTISGSVRVNEMEPGCLSRNCSLEVKYEEDKHSDVETSVSPSPMEISPERSVDVLSMRNTDSEERCPFTRTSIHEDCSTSGTLLSENLKALRKTRFHGNGERNKRKRWKGRHEELEFISEALGGSRKQDLSSTTLLARPNYSKEQQVSEKLLKTEVISNWEDKYELFLGMKELASRGMAAEVVEEVNAIDSNFFMQNPILLFQLKQVEFLKLVKCGDHSGALKVACSHLGPLASSDPTLLKPLKETLLALLKPNEEALGERLPLYALATSLQVAIGRRLGIEEPQLMKIMRAALFTHNEWFKLQMCKDRFEGLLRIDSLKEVSNSLLTDASKTNVDSFSHDSSHVSISSGSRIQEDIGSPTQVSSQDILWDENAILKVMEFLALPRADAIHLLAQYNGNAETVIQQIFA